MYCFNLDRLCRRQSKNRRKHVKSLQTKQIFFHDKKTGNGFLSKADLHEIHVLKSIWFPWLPRRNSVSRLRQSISEMRNQVAARVGQLDIVKRNPSLSESCAQRELYRKEIELEGKLSHINVYQSKCIPECQKRLHALENLIELNFRNNKNQKTHQPFVFQKSSENETSEKIPMKSLSLDRCLRKMDCQQDGSFILWRLPKIKFGLQNMKRNDNEEKISEKEKFVKIPDWFRRLCACGLRLDLQSSYPEEYFDNSEEFRILANQPRVLYVENLIGNKNERAWMTNTHFIVTEALLFSHRCIAESFQSSYRSCYDLENTERSIASRNLTKKKYHLNNKSKDNIRKTSHCDFMRSMPLKNGDTDAMQLSDKREYQGMECLGNRDNLGESINNKADKGNVMILCNKNPNTYSRKVIKESQRHNRWSQESQTTSSEVSLESISKKDTTRKCKKETISHRRDLKIKRPERKRHSFVSSDECYTSPALRPSIKSDKNFHRPHDVEIKDFKVNCTDAKKIKPSLNKNQRTDRIRHQSCSRALLKIYGMFQRLQTFIMASGAGLPEHFIVDEVTNNQAAEDPGVTISQKKISPNAGILSKSSTVSSSPPTATRLRRLSSRVEHHRNINNSSLSHSKICKRHSKNQIMTHSGFADSANTDRIICQYPYRSLDLVKERTCRSNKQSIRCAPSHKKSVDLRLKHLIYLPSYHNTLLGIHEFVIREWRKACQVDVEENLASTTSNLKSNVTNVSSKPLYFDDAISHGRISRVQDKPKVGELYQQPSVLGGFIDHECASSKNKFFGNNSILKDIGGTKNVQIYPEFRYPLYGRDKTTKVSRGDMISVHNIPEEEKSMFENNQMPPLSSICMMKDKNIHPSLSTRQLDDIYSHTLPESFQHSKIVRFANDNTLNTSFARSNVSRFTPVPVNAIRSPTPKLHNRFCSDSCLEININTSSKPSINTKWSSKKSSNVNPSITPMKVKTYRKIPLNVGTKMPTGAKRPHRKVSNNTSSIFSADTKSSSNRNAMILDNPKYALSRTPTNSINTVSALSEDADRSNSPSAPSPSHQRRELNNVYDYNQFPVKENNYQSKGNLKVIQADIENVDSNSLPEDLPKAFSDDISNPKNIPEEHSFISIEPTQQEFGNNVYESSFQSNRDYNSLSKHGKPTQAIDSYTRKNNFVSNKYPSHRYMNTTFHRRVSTDANSVGYTVGTQNGMKHQDSIILVDKSKNENDYPTAVRHRSYDYASKRRQRNGFEIPPFSSSRKRVDFAHGVVVHDQPCRMKNRRCPSTARVRCPSTPRVIPLCASSSEASPLGRSQWSNISPRIESPCVSRSASNKMPSRLYKYGASKIDSGKFGARASKSCNYSEETINRSKLNNDSDSHEKVQLSSTESIMKFQLQVLSYINQILCTGLSQTLTRNCDCSKKTPLETSSKPSAPSSPPHSRWLTNSHYPDPSIRRICRDTNAVLKRARNRSGQMSPPSPIKVETNKPYRGRIHQKDYFSFSDRKCHSSTKPCTVETGVQTELNAICDNCISGCLSKCSKLKDDGSSEVSDLNWSQESPMVAQVDNVKDACFLPNHQSFSSHVGKTNDKAVTMLYKSSNTAQTLSSYSKRKEKILINKKCQVGGSKISSICQTPMHSVYPKGGANSDSVNKECCQRDIGWSTKFDEWMQYPKNEVIEICADPHPKEGITKGASDSESFSIWQKTKKTYLCNDRSKGHYHHKNLTGENEQSKTCTSTFERMELDCLQKCGNMKNDLGSAKHIADLTNEKYSAAVLAKKEKRPAVPGAPPLPSPIIHIRYRTRKGNDNHLSKQLVAPEKQHKSIEKEMGQKLTEVIKRSLELQKEILKLQESSLNEKEETLKEKGTRITDTNPQPPAPSAMTNDGSTQGVASCENTNSNAKNSLPRRYNGANGYAFNATPANQNKKFTQFSVQLDNVSQKKLTFHPVEESLTNDNPSFLYCFRHFVEGQHNLTSQKSSGKFKVCRRQKAIRYCNDSRFLDEKRHKMMPLTTGLKNDGCKANDVFPPRYKSKCFIQLSKSQIKIYDESNDQEKVTKSPEINQKTSTIEKSQESIQKYMPRVEARKGFESKIITSSDGLFVTSNKCFGEVNEKKKLDFSQNCQNSSETIKTDFRTKDNPELDKSGYLSPKLPYQTSFGNYWLSQWDINCVGFAQTHLSVNQQMPTRQKDIARHHCNNLNLPILSERIKSKSNQKHLFDDRSSSSTLQEQSRSEKCHDKEPLNMLTQELPFERDQKCSLPNFTNVIHLRKSPFFKKRSSKVEAWDHKNWNSTNHVLCVDKSKCTYQIDGSNMTKEIQSSELSDSKSSTHGIEEIPLDTDSELIKERKMRQQFFADRRFQLSESVYESPIKSKRRESMDPETFAEQLRTKESVLEQSLIRPLAHGISVMTNDSFLDPKYFNGKDNTSIPSKLNRCPENTKNHQRDTVDSTSIQGSIVSVKENSEERDDEHSTDSIIISSLENTSMKSKSLDTETQIIHTTDLIGGREEPKMAHSSPQSSKSMRPQSKELVRDTQRNHLSNLVINWWNCPNVNESSILEISEYGHTNGIGNKGICERRKTVTSNHIGDDPAIANNSTDGFLYGNGRSGNSNKVIESFKDKKNHASSADHRFQPSFTTDIRFCPENHEKHRGGFKQRPTKLPSPSLFNSFSGDHSDSSGGGNLTQNYRIPLIGIGYIVEADDSKVILEGAFIQHPACSYPIHTLPSVSRAEMDVLNFRLVITHEMNSDPLSNGHQALNGTYRRQVEVHSDKLFTWHFSS